MFVHEEISLKEAIDKYYDKWMSMVCENSLNPSMMPEWMVCTSKSFSLWDEVRVFVLKQNEEVVAFIPFYLTKKKAAGLSVNCIEFAGNIVSYHQEVVTSISTAETIKYYISYIKERYDWDLLIGSDLNLEGQTYLAFKQILTVNGYNMSYYAGDSSPFLDLPADWEELLKSKSRKFRYKVRKREKELDSRDDWMVKWYPEISSTKLLEDLLRIEARSWKVKRNMDITGRPVEKAYYELLIPFLAKKNLLSANVLYMGEAPAAYGLYYVSNGVAGQIKTSFDDSLKSLSPGAIVLEDALRHYISQGIKEFDFLGDVMEHKSLWAKSVRAHESITIYNKKLKPYIIAKLRELKKMMQKND